MKYRINNIEFKPDLKEKSIIFIQWLIYFINEVMIALWIMGYNILLSSFCILADIEMAYYMISFSFDFLSLSVNSN